MARDDDYLRSEFIIGMLLNSRNVSPGNHICSSVSFVLFWFRSIARFSSWLNAILVISEANKFVPREKLDKITMTG